VVLCIVISYFIVKNSINRFLSEQQNKADNILKISKENARVIELEAKDESLKIMKETEAETQRRRLDLSREEERLQKRRSEVDFRQERLEQREANLNKRQSAMDKRANEIEHMQEVHLTELQKIAQMTLEEAHDEMLQYAEKEARSDMVRIIRQIEAEARQEGEKRAREIIADAIQRVASDHVSTVTTSLVELPNDEMKGRIATSVPLNRLPAWM
jgi:ribonuclease Y